MTVNAYKSDQLADGYRGRPTDDHGKLRFQYFKATISGAGDATSTVDLCELPTGAVRILPVLSRVTTSAFGASRTLDFGHRAYTSASGEADEAVNATAFKSALDVSGALAGVALSTVLKYDVYSYGGVTLFATVAGGTIPDGAVIEGLIAYLYE